MIKSTYTQCTTFYPVSSVISMGAANLKNKVRPRLNTRVDSNQGRSSSVFGQVYWSPTKSLWISLITIGAALGGYHTFRADAVLLCLATSAVTLCAGYSVGIHRRLIHNSFQCPMWLEHVLVYLGVLCGTQGPYSAIEKHDLHEWAKRQANCHSYFSHSKNPFLDWIWSLHCDIRLTYPPIIRYEPRIAQNTFYQWLEQTKYVQQVPLAMAFYHFGGWSWVFWGVYVRVAVCANVQWLTEYLVHHLGDRPHLIEGVIIQPRNLPRLGLLTLGEGWQSNHQAFPDSARFSLNDKQYDPGWWLIQSFKSVGLVWNIKQTRCRPQRKIRPVPMEANPQPVRVQQTRQKVGVK
ncbi:MAG: acyl-CoA desaturase [Cyanobacteria bacterium J06634_6]